MSLGVTNSWNRHATNVKIAFTVSWISLTIGALPS